MFKFFTNKLFLLAAYQVLEPFIEKFIYWGVPRAKVKLYENLAKHTQPAIDSLFKLKAKVKQSPNTLDDTCLKQGSAAIKAFADFLLDIHEKLEN